MFTYSEMDLIVFPITLASMLALSFLVWLFLRKRSYCVKRVPFILLFAIIIILEVIKQYREITNPEGYNLFSLPFHISSYYMLWMGLASLCKGKIRDIGMIASFILGFVMMCALLIEPHGIFAYSTTANLFTSFNAFHTFFYNFLIVQFFFFIIALDTFHPRFKAVIYFTIAFVLLLGLSLTMALLLDTNFANMLRGVGTVGDIEQTIGIYWLRASFFALAVFAPTILYFLLALPYDYIRNRFRANKKP